MSFDLYLVAGPGKTLDTQSFLDHFLTRPNYLFETGQAIYQNDDTGVYFSFDAPNEDGLVAFNLNFFRPHTFGLEAAIELALFARAFDARVFDEVTGDESPFDHEIFLRDWNKGNRFGYRALRNGNDDDAANAAERPLTWTSERILRVWNWNYNIPANEEGLLDGMFVPPILALKVNDRAHTCVVWPPGSPILMPEVDFVLVPLAQSGLATRKVALVPWAELAPLIQSYQDKAAGGLTRYRLKFVTWPRKIAAFLATTRSPMRDGLAIPLSEVLDQDLIDDVDLEHEPGRK